MKAVYFLFVVLIACQPKEKTISNQQVTEPDTVVVKMDLNEELAGFAYRNRATGYLLSVDGDSSIYIPAFTESRDGTVNLMLGLHPHLTYQAQMNQLRFLLAFAAEDYNFDSLSAIYVGRLVQTGDLAIDITNEYLAEFGIYGSTATTEYQKISAFLSRSKLARDINDLFSPYGLHTIDASVEKVFFANTPINWSIDSSLHSNIPTQVLDCMTWIRLDKKY